jgi:hypothetical protein
MDGEILECFIWLENNKIKEDPRSITFVYYMLDVGLMSFTGRFIYYLSLYYIFYLTYEQVQQTIVVSEEGTAELSYVLRLFGLQDRILWMEGTYRTFYYIRISSVS